VRIVRKGYGWQGFQRGAIRPEKAALRCPTYMKPSPDERQKLFIANIEKNVMDWQAAKRIFYANVKPYMPRFLQ
jgi:hypothetical protein